MSDVVERRISAEFILDAIRRTHYRAAIVPELSIEDLDLPDTGEPTDAMFMPSADPPDGHKFIRRIDALMFDSLIRTAIEIKVTREDFNRDTYWKRRAWLKVVHRFVYVVPDYLDVSAPHPCGLWKVAENGLITVVKKAVVSKTPEPLPQTVISRIAYRAASNALRGASGE
ncbi:DNA repair protein [Mycobacterium phage Purky]|uniref:Uncharacterized protein n=1 Tax=Mycobacterium phage Purky TaxID=2593351 RepID=A0A514TWU2_9CAUD|nr:DNA repair protein [Mycobacterium phage Purky]QDK01168.1 hypothetical protein SEA_PURKY_65 [Mycobacterium phage Purky]